MLNFNYGPQKIITPPLLNNDCLTGKRKLCFNASEVSNFVENSGSISIKYYFKILRSETFDTNLLQQRTQIVLEGSSNC
jgi:hypothetical protein